MLFKEMDDKNKSMDINYKLVWASLIYFFLCQYIKK
jgi:hypothetical protein